MDTLSQYNSSSLCAKSGNLKSTDEYPNHSQATVEDFINLNKEILDEDSPSRFLEQISQEPLKDYETRTPRFYFFRNHSMNMSLDIIEEILADLTQRMLELIIDFEQQKELEAVRCQLRYLQNNILDLEIGNLVFETLRLYYLNARRGGSRRKSPGYEFSGFSKLPLKGKASRSCKGFRGVIESRRSCLFHGPEVSIKPQSLVSQPALVVKSNIESFVKAISYQLARIFS